MESRTNSILRILIQLILTGPVLLFSPIAILVGIGTLFSPSRWGHGGMSNTLGFGLGWLGVIGLYLSIFIPVEVFRQHKGFRYSIIFFASCGFLAALAILFENADPIGFLSRSGFFAIHFLFGSTIVGIWNLIRIFKTAPNP